MPELIPQMDTVLWDEPQIAHKIGLLEKAKEQFGVSAGGFEFLLAEHRDVVRVQHDVKKYEEIVRDVERRIRALGIEPFLSLHAPWSPMEMYDLDHDPFGNADAFDFLLGFCPDMIRCVNIHMHSGCPLDKLYSFEHGKPLSFAHKRERLIAVRRNVQELMRRADDPSRIAIEHVPVVSKSERLLFMNHLPYEYEEYVFPSLRGGAGFTLDTAHMGIEIDACRRFAGGFAVPGLFSEELAHAHRVADMASGAFLPLARMTTHLHLSINDREGNEGRVPGMPGTLGEEEYKGFLREYLGRMDEQGSLARGREVGAVLEIAENDFTNSINTWKMLKLLRDFWKK